MFELLKDFWDFMRTQMDCLVIENFILEKSAQPPSNEDQSWQDEFELD